ncbi:MAG: hypothetical protein LBT24_06230 [Tannerella sp.]|jgi:hypothetical protein|nr:hypothetical protein [Tannerella sp.]
MIYLPKSQPAPESLATEKTKANNLRKKISKEINEFAQLLTEYFKRM